MSAASDFLENALANHVLNNIAYASPANVFLALSTANPTDTGAGIAEPVGNNYSRTAVVGNFTVTAGVASNTLAIQTAIASGAWGTLTHFALYDAASGGNLLVHGALDASVAPIANQLVQFAIGALAISVQ